MTEQESRIIIASQFYAAKGLPIFPCKPHEKTPATAHGCKDATTDRDQIAQWWAADCYNIGLATGGGLVVLDVDVDHDAGKFGDETLAELEREHGELPDTWESLTGSGGRHLFFHCSDPELTVAAGFAPGLDYRGAGGYVVAPPSIHPNGRTYEWEVNHTPQNCQLAELPEWLHNLMVTVKKPQKPQGKIEIPQKIAEGGRNEMLFKFASSLRAQGLTVDEMFLSVMAINRSRCKPELSEREVRTICKSAGKYEPGKTATEKGNSGGSKKETIIPAAEGIEIPEFTEQEYCSTTIPYQWLYQFHDNGFQMKQLCNQMGEICKAVTKNKVKNFVAQFGEYCKSFSKSMGETRTGSNQIDFSQQQVGLWCGSWIATDNGITGVDRFGNPIEALSHPLYPVRILKNIDSNLEKIELCWYRGNARETSHIFLKSIVANASSIVRLADYGIAVTSENAKSLVRFLSDVESLNRDTLEKANSVGRLGWIDGYGFSPYIENLVFDGEDAFSDRFSAIQARGDRQAWLDGLRSIRAKESPIIRIVFAASLASCLVKPAGIMPFVVHLWGQGGTGKTVCMMLAASIWGNPEVGRYIKSFNSTAVGKELGAVFLNSMPLMLDELQIASGGKDKIRQMIYELTEGVGRERGRKEGGLQKSGTWRNVTITTGEQPIVEPSWTEGAKYRTIEIKCSDIHFFESGNTMGKNAKEVVSFVLKNYGFFGKEFVERLIKEGPDHFLPLHDEYTEKIRAAGDIDSKQAMAAALIMVADTLAERWIFQDGVLLKVSDLLPYLITKDEASQDRKAFAFLQECAARHKVHFDPELCEAKNTEIWGELKHNGNSDYIAILPSKFNELLESEGYNVGKFIEWGRKTGNIRVGKDGKSAISTRITGVRKTQRCFWVFLENAPAEDDEAEIDLIP